MIVIDTLLLNLVLKLSDSQSFLLADVLSLVGFVLLHLFDLSLQMLNLRLDLVSVRLLDQDDLRVLDRGQVLVLLLIVTLLD